MKIQKQVEVSKEASELLEGIAEIVKATKQALKDGFQAGQDVPAIVAAAWAKLPSAVQGIDQIPAEFAEDKAALLKAVSIGAADIVEELMKKDAPQA